MYWSQDGKPGEYSTHSRQYVLSKINEQKAYINKDKTSALFVARKFGDCSALAALPSPQSYSQDLKDARAFARSKIGIGSVRMEDPFTNSLIKKIWAPKIYDWTKQIGRAHV